ncbi:hypothetical protein C0991_010240 [Blastosporella zonata]|nr:hypothetical protein C0991_010240 [Blastosporella zonata]
MANLYEIESTLEFQDLLSVDLERVSLLNFWTSWAPPCIQMNQVVEELAKKYRRVLFLNIEAEIHSEISESFDIEAVPSFVILRGHNLLKRFSGADAAGLTQALVAHVTGPTKKQSRTEQAPMPASDVAVTVDEKYESPEELDKRMYGLMNQSRVVLFMKGTPEAPRCGFSRKISALLQDNNIEFSYFDILNDEAVRQGLKKLNDWPTFPQLIVGGELVGGLDIVQEMVDNGELEEALA